MAQPTRAFRAAAIALLAIGLALLQGSVVLAADASVTINNYQFTPKSIAVKPGDSITWTNKQADDDHTVTADDGSFDTGTIAHAGGKASLTFAVEGTFTYHCTIHPSMHGTVVVSSNAQEAPATDTVEFLRGGAASPVPLSLILMLVGAALVGLSAGLLLRRAVPAR